MPDSPNRLDPPPDLAVVVAVHDEAHTIAGKLRELAALDDSALRLEFVIVDGGSSDGTAEAVAAQAARDPRFDAVFTRYANKTAQLNEALDRVRAPWVLVTDADARMPAGTLARLVAATADPRVGVVGTPVAPHRPHPLDAWHWRLSNWIRRTERRAGGATGLAVAPCYLFRRDLIDRFPEDVAADDVYVVCRAAERGAVTTIVASEVVELRAAAGAFGWYRHKVRRTLGYLREVVRFAPAIARIESPMRAVLLWRVVALTIAPVAGLALGVAAALAVGLSLPAAVALLLAAGAGVPAEVTGRPRAIAAAALPLWVLLIALTALALYPFVRQTGSFGRAGLRVGRSEAWS